MNKTYLRQINDRHQITIPAALLRMAGIPEHALFSLQASKGKILLEQKKVVADDWTDEDFELMDRAVKKQLRARQYTTYKNPKQAKKHLDRWRK